MKLEHVALNVAEPLQMTEWYEKHLGLTKIKQMQDPPYTTFLADESGGVLIELYNNPVSEVPPYARMDPLLLHLAFVSQDPGKEKLRLIEAGASFVSDQHFADGTHLVMMRDPWGLSIQFCKRGVSMLK